MPVISGHVESASKRSASARRSWPMVITRPRGMAATASPTSRGVGRSRLLPRRLSSTTLGASSGRSFASQLVRAAGRFGLLVALACTDRTAFGARLMFGVRAATIGISSP